MINTVKERIKNLAIQARGEVKRPGVFTEAEFEEKFAELIVLKCAEIADTAEPFLASDLIKEHLGVKE